MNFNKSIERRVCEILEEELSHMKYEFDKRRNEYKTIEES